MNYIDTVISKIGKQLQDIRERGYIPKRIIVSRKFDLLVEDFYEDELSHFGNKDIQLGEYSKDIFTKLYRLFGLRVDVGYFYDMGIGFDFIIVYDIK